MLEIKSTDDLQSSRLNSIESLDKTQNERLNKIEALNELQSTHLTQHDEALSKQATDLSSTADAIRQEEKALAARLKTAEDTLKETKAKNEQLEGLLRVYAAATSNDTVFTLFRLDSKDASFIGSPNLDDIFNLLKDSSATLTFNIEDDPNWRAPAYSELLFNGAVVSNERSYEGTVNSDLTVKHRNTLTERVSPIKTIRFVEPVGPENPTNVSWLNTPDPVGSTRLKWSSHLAALTAAATSQNGSLYGWLSQQIVEYSSASKDWTQVPASYNLSEMFSRDSQINLRVKYIVYDIIGNSKEFIINLGTLNVTDARRTVKEYSIAEITNTFGYKFYSKTTNSAADESGAFNGSFILQDPISMNFITASFTNTFTIHCSNDVDFVSSGMKNEQGAYEFSCNALNMNIYIKIQETPNTSWCTVD